MRRKAQLSSGPVSPEPTPRSAENATTDTPTPVFAILPHEDRAGFDKLLDTYRNDFKPATEHETFLVRLMAQSRWRLDRIGRLETLALSEILGEPVDPNHPDAKILAKMTERGDAMAILHRYAAAAERSYFRAHRELTQARKAQKRNEAEASWAKFQQEYMVPEANDDAGLTELINWRPGPKPPKQASAPTHREPSST